MRRLLLLPLLLTACRVPNSAFTPPAPTPTTLSVPATTLSGTIAANQALPIGGPLNVTATSGAARTDPTWGSVRDLTVTVPSRTTSSSTLLALFPGCTGSVQETTQGPTVTLTSLPTPTGPVEQRLEGLTRDGMRVARQTVYIYATGGGRAFGALSCPSTSASGARTVTLSAVYPAGWSTLLLLEAPPAGRTVTDVFLKNEPDPAAYPTHWHARP